MHIVQLNISGCGLRLVNLLYFTKLLVLDVSDNPEIYITDNFIPRQLESLTARGQCIKVAYIHECVAMKMVDFSYNSRMLFYFDQFAPEISVINFSGCRLLFIDVRRLLHL